MEETHGLWMEESVLSCFIRSEEHLKPIFLQKKVYWPEKSIVDTKDLSIKKLKVDLETKKSDCRGV